MIGIIMLIFVLNASGVAEMTALRFDTMNGCELARIKVAQIAIEAGVTHIAAVCVEPTRVEST